MRSKDQSPDAGLDCIIVESMERPITSGPVQVLFSVLPRAASSLLGLCAHR